MMDFRALPARLALGLLLIVSSQSAFALFCGSATNQAHVSAGRAYVDGYVYAKAEGSNQDMGLYYSDSAVLKETSDGYYEVVNSCGNSGGPNGPYEHASDRAVPTIVDITGNYGVAMAGGHFLENSSGGSSFPRERIVGSSDSIDIPDGAVVRYAFLYYGGIIGLGNDSFTDGDFTPDGLNSLTDVQNNGVSFAINGVNQGTYDPSNRQPPNQTEVGSEGKIADNVFHADFGTLTDTRTSFWSNRLDITNLLQGKSGSVTFDVNAPEELDINVNSSGRNGGNPAGTTLYNSCLGAANWGLVVIYEHPDEASKQLILKDDIVRAWDYIWFHKGEWNRPKVTFENHAPMTSGAKVYLMGQTGNPAGFVTPGQPYCTCGCGGSFNLRQQNPTNKSGDFWSYTLVDPEETWDDPLHRDSSNGPWNVVSTMGTNGQSLRGNDWTLFQSGDRFTEFPNLYEGENTPADNITPLTQEDIPDASGDTYGGHPWDGRGVVTYHGWGNDLSVVEIALDDSAITPGETSTSLYFKGDQKDVFKPQARVTVRYMLLEIPVSDQGNQAPSISLLGDNPLNLTVGDTFTDPGATAADPEDGDISADIVSNCNVDTANAGNYQCTYNVTDSEGLAAPTVTRNVVVADEQNNQPPSITVVGANPLTLNVGDSFTDPGATASDPEDGDLTGSIVSNCDVDTSVAGNYSCSYSVTDSGGLSDTANRSVVVQEQANTPPSITLLGANPLELDQGGSFSDPGATASDAEDGDLTGSIVANCNVDTSVAGDYQCTYSVTDSQGAETTAVRDVVVIPADTRTCTASNATPANHENAGRAYSTVSWWWRTYYAVGSDQQLPATYWGGTVALHRFSDEPNTWYVGACP